MVLVAERGQVAAKNLNALAHIHHVEFGADARVVGSEQFAYAALVLAVSAIHEVLALRTKS